jgi:tetratricopeptide (TPR) repeat protein
MFLKMFSPKYQESIGAASRDVQGRMRATSGMAQNSPNDAESLFTLGSLYAYREMWEEAIHYFEQDLMLTPHDLSVLNDLSICYWNQGAYAKCYETLHRLRAVDASSWFALDMLCVVSGKLDRWDDAVTYGEDAVRRGGFRFGEALGNLAQAYIEVGRHDDAVQILARALQLDPKNSELDILLARANAGRSESHNASDHFDKMSPRTAVDVSAYLETVEQLRCEGRYEEAIEELRRALRIDPGCGEVIRTLGRLFCLSKQFPESISSFIHAEARGVNLNADDLFMLGHAYASKSFHHKALESFDRSLALAERAETHFARGMSYQKLQDLDNAVRCYLDVLRADPGHSMAHCSLASVYALKGDFATALLEYGKWIRIQLGDASPGYTVVIDQLKSGDPEGALEGVRELLNRNAEDPEGYFLRGWAYAGLGRVGLAVQALEECLRLSTHHPLALSFLVHVKQ